MKLIIFVIDDLVNSGSRAEMSAIDTFNDKLRANGHWIFAGGLAAPSFGEVIDNRDDAGIEPVTHISIHPYSRNSYLVQILHEWVDISTTRSQKIRFFH